MPSEQTPSKGASCVRIIRPRKVQVMSGLCREQGERLFGTPRVLSRRGEGTHRECGKNFVPQLTTKRERLFSFITHTTLHRQSIDP